MNRSVFNSIDTELLIKRVQSLDVNSKPLWGKMNVCEMLLHCNLANTQILDGELGPGSSSIKQRIIKMLCLHILRKFPRNVKGAESIDTHGTIHIDEVEIQRDRFIAILRQYPFLKKPIQLHHPAFGKLSHQDWGLATWMHIDHHLRQFGQ